MGHLEEYEHRRKKVDDYYNRHQLAIMQEVKDRERNIILENMPKLQNISVWCRNAIVCRKATHCNMLMCECKKQKQDVVNGCSECREFVVTTLSNVWELATHLFDHGKVTGSLSDR